jgi:short-subunit dehydrogenase
MVQGAWSIVGTNFFEVTRMTEAVVPLMHRPAAGRIV